MRKYSIKARFKKRWFKAPVMVYDIIEHFQVWHDPSYGNGGGDYRNCELVLATLECCHAAELALNSLNKYKGEQ